MSQSVLQLASQLKNKFILTDGQESQKLENIRNDFQNLTTDSEFARAQAQQNSNQTNYINNGDTTQDEKSNETKTQGQNNENDWNLLFYQKEANQNEKTQFNYFYITEIPMDAEQDKVTSLDANQSISNGQQILNGFNFFLTPNDNNQKEEILKTEQQMTYQDSSIKSEQKPLIPPLSIQNHTYSLRKRVKQDCSFNDKDSIQVKKQKINELEKQIANTLQLKQDNLQNQKSSFQMEEFEEKYIETEEEEEEVKHDQKQLKNDILEMTIEVVLQGQTPSDELIQQLNDEQQVIFNSIIQKKTGIDPTLQNGLNSDEFIQCQNQLQKKGDKSKASKREEEKQKMFFKKSFKVIENNYFHEQKKKKRIHRKQKNYHQFYNFYFSDVASKLNIDIHNYYHPQKNTTTKQKSYKNLQDLNSTQKSFNQAYLDRILESTLYRNAVKEYLYNRFRVDMKTERKQKIKKFVQKCYSIIQKTQKQYEKCEFPKSNNEYVKTKIKEQLKSYILKDRSCKIPWTDEEIEDVSSYADIHLSQFELKLINITNKPKK